MAPCGKIFPCQRDLSLHRVNNPECLARFDTFLQNLQPQPFLSSDSSETESLPYDDTETGSSEAYYPIEIIGPSAPDQGIFEAPPVIPSDHDESVFEDIFPGAGTILETEEPTFARQRLALLAQQLSNDYPFPTESDRSLAAWLHESGISRVKMDQFFQLSYVSSRGFSSISDYSLTAH